MNQNINLKFVKEHYLFILLAVYLALPGIVRVFGSSFFGIWKDYILVAAPLALVLMIAFAAYDGKLKPDLKEKNWTFIFFGALAVWMFISTLVNGFVHDSVIGSSRSHTGLICSLCYLTIFLMAYMIREDRLKRILIHVFLVSSILISLGVTITFFCYPMSRISIVNEVFLNSNHLGYFVMTAAMAASMVFMLTESRKQSVILGVVAAVNVSALIISDTLGSILGLIVGLVFMVIVLALCGKFNWKKYIILILIFVLTIGLLSVTDKSGIVSNMTQSNLAALTESADAAADIKNADDNLGSGRMELWRCGVECIKDRPVFGYGLAEMREQLLDASAGKNNTVHNEFLEYATNHGLPALIFYVAGIMAVFFRGLRYRKQLTKLNIIGICTAFTYLVSSFMGVTIFYTAPLLFIFLGMGYYRKPSEEEQYIWERSKKGNKVRKRK